MKRSNISDSMSALISMCSSKEMKLRKENQGYSEEFQAMLERFEQEDSSEETSLILEKKRRLGFDQVKALERSFDLGNKLDLERKVKLAQELGLQPRQVAIWFQNRRARWKAKQLERDYSILKSNFDALKIDYSNLEQENEALTIKLRELKAKNKGNGAEMKESVKEESPISDVESQKFTEQNFAGSAASGSNSNGAVKEESNVDSPLCFNESFPSSGSIINWLQYSDSRGSPERDCQRMEEQSLISINEIYNFFSVDQSPAL